ncbi:hypothetical protein O3P69_010431 [Scylla paramamosain]|uniref:Uncharacterized protein n=1 Tax=Scylla paramamosain TaxID=85552 RepID=A0AAW0TTV5_SCYPA
MEGRRALLIFLLFPHLAPASVTTSTSRNCSSPFGSRPLILAKEGLTEEEVDWVPDVKPLQTIKENYVSGSREFDHHFSYETHPKVRHSAPHTLAPSTTLPPPPPPPPPHEPPTSHTEAPTPDTPAHEPHTDSPITYTDTPAPHAPPHPHPFPSLHRQPFKVVLPLRQRPRKYFLAGGEDTHTHEDAPSHSGPFRKYYLDPDSKATQDIDSLSSHEKPLHPHFFPVLPPAYPQPLHPRPPPTVRQYFLQPAADEEPHVADLTTFEVYEKLRKTRTVDTQVDTEARAWVLSGIPKATSWVSSSTGRRLS